MQLYLLHNAKSSPSQGRNTFYIYGSEGFQSSLAFSTQGISDIYSEQYNSKYTINCILNAVLFITYICNKRMERICKKNVLWGAHALSLFGLLAKNKWVSHVLITQSDNRIIACFHSTGILVAGLFCECIERHSLTALYLRPCIVFYVHFWVCAPPFGDHFPWCSKENRNIVIWDLILIIQTCSHTEFIWKVLVPN